MFFELWFVEEYDRCYPRGAFDDIRVFRTKEEAEEYAEKSKCDHVNVTSLTEVLYWKELAEATAAQPGTIDAGA